MSASRRRRPRGSPASGSSPSTWPSPSGTTGWPVSGHCWPTTASSTWSWRDCPTGGAPAPSGRDRTNCAGSCSRPAEALGAGHLKVTPDPSGTPWDAGHWAAEFALLAAQAADAGARLGIEFLPWSNIRTVHDGLRLVEDAGHPAGGIVIDVWHVERAGTPAAELAALPLHRIVGVELDDADREVVGTLFEDTVDRRRYCGEGTFDLADIITALRTAGWSGPWGVEILSTEHRRLDVRQAAAHAATTARRLLEATPAHR